MVAIPTSAARSAGGDATGVLGAAVAGGAGGAGGPAHEPTVAPDGA